VSGIGNRDKAIVGDATGVLTLWERGVWDDQDSRIIIDKGPNGGESIDCLVTLPDGVGTGSKTVVAGVGSGLLAFVKIGQNKIVEVLKHDEVEGVVDIGFDVAGRMITGGGGIVKIWREIEVGQANGGAVNGEKDSEDSDEEYSDDSGQDSEEETRPRKRRKKSKVKGIDAVHKRNGTGVSFAGLD
jgi:WD repeat-containing protein 55